MESTQEDWFFLGQYKNSFSVVLQNVNYSGSNQCTLQKLISIMQERPFCYEDHQKKALEDSIINLEEQLKKEQKAFKNNIFDIYEQIKMFLTKERASSLIGCSENINREQIEGEISNFGQQRSNHVHELFYINTSHSCSMSKYRIELSPDMYLVSLHCIQRKKFAAQPEILKITKFSDSHAANLLLNQNSLKVKSENRVLIVQGISKQNRESYFLSDDLQMIFSNEQAFDDYLKSPLTVHSFT